MPVLDAIPDNAQRIGPQEGPQTDFMQSEADVVVYGGAAGGGKSYALLLDALYFAALDPVPDFNAVIFRRTAPQLRLPGGLWPTSGSLYPLAGGKPNKTDLIWEWPQHRTSIKLAHLQYEDDRFDWQGAQIAYLAFDEGTHFSETTFWYLFSRNRTTCGVRPRVRLTCNPDPDSWLAEFLAQWVDPEHPHQARPGEIRWFYRDGGQLEWLLSHDDRPAHIPAEWLKTATFIPSNLSDNPALTTKNPEYEAVLRALPYVEQMRLLGGDWKIRPEGNYFKSQWFIIEDEAPDNLTCIRWWDLAGTEPSESNRDPDWTAGVLIGRDAQGDYWITDVVRDRLSPGGTRDLVRQTAILDGKGIAVGIEQEPGSSGKTVADDYVRLLDGWDIQTERATGSKEVRARPFAGQAKAGHIHVL